MIFFFWVPHQHGSVTPTVEAGDPPLLWEACATKLLVPCWPIDGSTILVPSHNSEGFLESITVIFKFYFFFNICSRSFLFWNKLIFLTKIEKQYFIYVYTKVIFLKHNQNNTVQKRNILFFSFVLWKIFFYYKNKKIVFIIFCLTNGEVLKI